MYFSRWLGYLYSHYLLIASLIWAHELLPIDNLVTHIGVYIFFILFYFPLISIGVTIFINIYYYGEYEFVILQTSKLALLGIRAQIVSLAVFNVSSIILLNKESLYPMSANFLSSSHLTYIFSTYFLSSWTGVLSFKRPLNIDYGRINIICLVYFITNELIRPYSCLTILATHFVMFVHIIEMELFRRQKEFLMTYGLLNFGNQYADDSFICASRYLRITVHAEF